MAQFKDRQWDDRFKKGGMGDEAEARFEEYCQRKRRGFVRYGLDRPPIKVPELPTRIRYTPDYLTTKAFVEVQGFGQDGIFKLKVEKYNSLHWWNNSHPVHIYVWDSYEERECIVHLFEVDRLVNEGAAELNYFPEGKAYFAIHGHYLFEEAEHEA